jgi:hypothetical protein
LEDEPRRTLLENPKSRVEVGRWKLRSTGGPFPSQLRVDALRVKLRRLPAARVAHLPPSRPPARKFPSLVPRATRSRSSGCTPASRELPASPGRASVTEASRSRIVCEPFHEILTISSQTTRISRLSDRIQSPCSNVTCFWSQSCSPCPQPWGSPFRPPQAPNGGQQIRT